MKVLNFGSLNIDKIYEMDHFIRPKETVSALSFNQGFGGKGLNQSIALARAGLEVYHAGKIGSDGVDFISYLNEYGVDTRYLSTDEKLPTGHAIIQVCGGENCIIITGGANQAITQSDIDATLSHFEKDDVLLIQNEISSLPYLIQKAHEIGMRIVFNTAPMDENIFTCPLEFVDIFVVNEIEAKGLSESTATEYIDIARDLQKKYPTQEIVFTCGKDGAYYLHGDTCIYDPARIVDAVDTTAAGDTFTGFFLASLLSRKSPGECLKIATVASSITVQHAGAAQSIPSMEDVMKSLSI